MSNLFYGLNTAKNTLQAQNAVLNTTAHNIANANTPGFSRQSVTIVPIPDAANRGFGNASRVSIGGGVEAKIVTRNRFALYDVIYRTENQNLNDFTKTEELMHQVELLFDEPSDRGLSGVLNNFFNGWQEVANDPQNMAARESLKSNADELASRMHRIYNQLQTMREDINTELANIPDRINEIAGEIANLNVSIRVTENQNASANDLRDKRDNLIDELSGFVNVRSVEQKDGTITVIIGSNVLVEHDAVSKLHVVTELSEDEGINKTVIMSEEGTEYAPQSGKMGALIKFRDNTLKQIMDKLDVLAESIVTSVNYEHRYGYGLDGGTGRNFFDPTKTKAFNIGVSADISDVTNIAASGDGSVGDNANALRINDVKDQKKVKDTFSIFEYYNALIANIGIMAREAQSGRTNEELLVNQIDNAREGIKGVSIDEELVQMIQTQRIYQAASRLIVVIDTLLEDILRMVG